MNNRIEDIQINKPDSRGLLVTHIHSRVSKRYVIYMTEKDVRIHFADNDDMGVNQRADLWEVLALHSKVEALLQDYMTSDRPDHAKKLRKYRNAIAGALHTSLTGNVAAGVEDMRSIRDAIIEERAAAVRCQHLLYAGVATLAVIIIARILHSDAFDSLFETFSDQISPTYWHAASIGAIGALFSIAMQIRDRPVRLYDKNWDDAINATMRILVGAISAVLLVALLQSNLVTLAINNTRVAFSNNPHLLTVIAFAAGFAEKLVSDIFANVAVSQRRATDTATQTATAGATERSITGEAPREPGSSPPPARPALPAQPQGSDVQEPPYTDPEDAIEPDADENEATDTGGRPQGSPLPYYLPPGGPGPLG